MADVIFNDIYARLIQIEEVVFGRRGGPRVDPRYDRRLGKKELAMRRGTSVRTLERDVKRGVVPAPEVDANGRWFWWMSTLQAHEEQERAAARERGAAVAAGEHAAV